MSSNCGNNKNKQFQKFRNCKFMAYKARRDKFERHPIKEKSNQPHQSQYNQTVFGTAINVDKKVK